MKTNDSRKYPKAGSSNLLVIYAPFNLQTRRNKTHQHHIRRALEPIIPMNTLIYSCPQSSTITFALVAPEPLPTPSTALTTFIPSTTEPKTTCLPSSQEVSAVQRKNWLPFVFGPAVESEGNEYDIRARIAETHYRLIQNYYIPFAILKIPGPVCLSWKFSSANFPP